MHLSLKQPHIGQQPPRNKQSIAKLPSSTTDGGVILRMRESPTTHPASSADDGRRSFVSYGEMDDDALCWDLSSKQTLLSVHGHALTVYCSARLSDWCQGDSAKHVQHNIDGISEI